MTKAEEIALNHGYYLCSCHFLAPTDVEVTGKEYVVAAINDTLEWAAQQCEFMNVPNQSCGACAKRIRAGKSKP